MIPKKEWARDTLRMLLLLGAAVAVCSVLSRVHDDNNPFAIRSSGCSASITCSPTPFGALI